MARGTRSRPGVRTGTGGERVAAHPRGPAAVVVLAVIHRRADIHPQAAFRFLLDLVEREIRLATLLFKGANHTVPKKTHHTLLTCIIVGRIFSSKSNNNKQKNKKEPKNKTKTKGD